jgi:hypothetical protein
MTDQEAERLEDLRQEARYRRERLALHKARLYAGKARSKDKLRELQRASDGAAARVRRVKEQGSTSSNLQPEGRAGSPPAG